MKKVLLPIDGSERSIRAIDTVQTIFNPGEVEIHIIKVVPSQLYIHDEPEKKHSAADQSQLEAAAVSLMDYTVHTKIIRGSSPGVEIIEYAKAHDIDTVIMTRSSRSPLRKLGSVTTYLVKNANSLNVFVLRDED